VTTSQKQEQALNARYADIAIPLLSEFIVAVSLLFVKATYDLRESIKQINRFRENRAYKH